MRWSGNLFYQVLIEEWFLQPVHKDAEVLAEDEQLFLLKLQAVLSNQAMVSSGITMVMQFNFNQWLPCFMTEYMLI